MSFWKKLVGGELSSLTGIDIGSGSVKLAEVGLGGSQPVLKAVAMRILPPGVFEDGEIVDMNAMVVLLSQLLSDAGSITNDVVVAVSGKNVFVREILFPVMSDADLKEAVKWDLEKYIPLESSLYNYDYCVIGKSKNGEKLRILLVATPHERINTILTMLAGAGLRPIAIDIESLALFRTLDNATNSLVVDVGHLVTQAIVFQDGSPVATRIIPIGGKSFTEKIMGSLNLEYGEAERIKRQQSGLLGHVSGHECGDAFLQGQLGELVDELVREIRRVAEYYQIQNRDAVIDNVYLTGGGMHLYGLAHLLADKLDITVIKHRQFGMLIDPTLDTTYVDTMFSQLAVAIGLALHGGDK